MAKSVFVMQRLFRLCILLTLLLQACFSFLSDGNGTTDVPFVIPTLKLSDGSVNVSPKKMDDYLVNPGMGFQDGPETYGFVGFPTTVSYSDRRRIAWEVLNPQEGVYDWTALERQLEDAKDQDDQFSFRVYTMVGEEFGGHVVPQWVLDKGALLMENGEPDYSNCIYQEEWGKFVVELQNRYDGNPDIAFVDISGYGNFNEWSWQDIQTEWDDQWASGYAAATAAPAMFLTLDGQARRRLADMFIGGDFDGHRCRTANGSIQQVNYSYNGFQKTQLVMPYAGVRQSSQYVFSRRKDVGIRYDCLGADGEDVYEGLVEIFSEIWKTAPVVFEMCTPGRVDAEDAAWLLKAAHGSLVHNNEWQYGSAVLEEMMLHAGYRYSLDNINIEYAGRLITLDMDWQNLGYAPHYPKMGQDFHLEYYLLNSNDDLVFTFRSDANISSWLPSSDGESIAYSVTEEIHVPQSVDAGHYQFALAIQDDHTASPIQLPIDGHNADGYYVLAQVDVY